MINLTSILTDKEFGVIAEALEGWNQSGHSQLKASRTMIATLVQAKLLLIRYGAQITHSDDESNSIHVKVQERMEFAEQFMRECGVWRHFEAFLTETIASKHPK